MIRFLIQEVSFITLLMICSCRNNHTENRAKSYKIEDQSLNKKNTIPIAVSVMELCTHFNTNVGLAVTKYKDNILILSGKADQVEVAPVDNNCRDVIMSCQHTDSRDTRPLSIVIRQCIRNEVANDTIVPGKDINIQCRFIEYRNNIIHMEEVGGAKN